MINGRKKRQLFQRLIITVRCIRKILLSWYEAEERRARLKTVFSAVFQPLSDWQLSPSNWLSPRSLGSSHISLVNSIWNELNWTEVSDFRTRAFQWERSHRTNWNKLNLTAVSVNVFKSPVRFSLILAVWTSLRGPHQGVPECVDICRCLFRAVSFVHLLSRGQPAVMTSLVTWLTLSRGQLMTSNDDATGHAIEAVKKTRS